MDSSLELINRFFWWKKNGSEFTIKIFMPSYYIRTEFTFSCDIPTCVRVPILYKYKHILHCIYLHIPIIQPAAAKSYNIMIYDDLLIQLKECHITFFIYNYYYIQTNQTVLFIIIFFIISIRFYIMLLLNTCTLLIFHYLNVYFIHIFF